MDVLLFLGEIYPLKDIFMDEDNLRNIGKLYNLLTGEPEDMDLGMKYLLAWNGFSAEGKV